MKVNKVEVTIINALRVEAARQEKDARKSAANGYWRCAAEEYSAANALRASIDAFGDGHLTPEWVRSVFPNLK